MFHEYKDEAKRSQSEKLHRMSGGSASHSDEKEDRALVNKMVKKESLTGKKRGGKTVLTRQKRADGGKTSNKSDKQKPTMHTTIVISPHKGQAGPQSMGAPQRPVGPSVPPTGLPPQLMSGLAQALSGAGAGGGGLGGSSSPQGPMKRGGKVGKLTPINRHPRSSSSRSSHSHGGSVYTAGAGNGEGRLEKIEHLKGKKSPKDY